MMAENMDIRNSSIVRIMDGKVLMISQGALQ